MATVLTIYNFKGGVGKTTTTYHIALSLAQQHNVLVIDCDPQTNLTSLLTKGQNFQGNFYNHIRSFLHHRPCDIEPVHISNNLSLIPGSPDMIELESNNQFIEFGPMILQQVIQYVDHSYDYILIDCPSYFGKTVKCILANSNHLLIPMTPDIFSIKGAVRLIKSLKQISHIRRLQIAGLFFNRYRSNSKYHKKIKDLSARIFGGLYISQTVRNSASINDSFERVTSGRKITKGPNRLDEDYTKLVGSVLERIKTSIITRIPKPPLAQAS